MDKVAIFVDAAAMFYAQRDLGWHMDFKRVLQYFSDNRTLDNAYYFSATPPPGDENRIRKYRGFKNALMNMGYRVIDKEVKVIRDKKGVQVKLKGNLDIELIFRMLVSVDKYDIAVLLGGDSDYLPILEHISNLGKTIYVVGNPASTAWELRNIANFISLDQIRDRIEKLRP